MLAERLGRDWQARKASAPVDAVMRFSDKGLIFGGGTVLAPTGGSGRDISIDEGEPRLLALLAAAHLRTPSHVALTHLRKAAESWNRGEDALAAMHLTLSRLDRLADPDADARRLFLTDKLLREGMAPGVLVKALGLGVEAAETLERYNPNQPRVPAGSGRSSGEWTSGGAGSPAQVAAPKGHPKPAKPPNRTALPAKPRRPKASAPMTSTAGRRASATALAGAGSSMGLNPNPKPALAGAAAAGAAIAIGRPVGVDLGALSPGATSRLAGFLAALPGEAALTASMAGVAVIGGLGLSFMPFPEATEEWIDVAGPGDVSYFRSLYVPSIAFRYTDANGVRQQVTGVPGPDNNYRDPKGRVLARIVRTGAKIGLIISTATLLDSDMDDPKLCPAPEKEKNEKSKGRDYEDFMKALFNPGNPTPRGFAYDFKDPRTGDDVSIDDCQQRTEILGEYKGPGYAKHILHNDGVWEGGMKRQLISQVDRQERAREGRRLIWFVDEKPLADWLKSYLRDAHPDIDVEWVPMPGDAQ